MEGKVLGRSRPDLSTLEDVQRELCAPERQDRARRQAGGGLG